MKRLLAALALLIVTGSGCAPLNHTEAGAAGGGIIGGALGTVVGAATGHPLAGAAIGAGSGALLGGAVGHAEDRREQRQVQAAADWQARHQVTVPEVIQMTHQHVGDNLIIQQIDSTYSNFDIRPEDITMLKQQGVSDRVILAMQQRRVPPPGAYRVRPASGVVVYEPLPPPPPPVAVGVGVGFGYGGRRGCW